MYHEDKQMKSELVPGSRYIKVRVDRNSDRLCFIHQIFHFKTTLKFTFVERMWKTSFLIY